MPDGDSAGTPAGTGAGTGQAGMVMRPIRLPIPAPYKRSI